MTIKNNLEKNLKIETHKISRRIKTKLKNLVGKIIFEINKKSAENKIF